MKRDQMGPRRNLWLLTRHARLAGGLTLSRIQRLCGDAFKGCAKTRLNDFASGNLRALTPVQLDALLDTLDSLGLRAADFGAEEGDWLSPLAVRVERRCSNLPQNGRVLPDAVRGKPAVAGPGAAPRHHTHARRFDESINTRTGLNGWKRSTRMPLTDDTLAHFSLAAGRDPFDAPRGVEDLYQTADFQAKERTLRAALARGGYSLVKGPSGVGKSMLAHAALERLAKERRLIVCRVMAPDTRRVSEYSIIYALIDDIRRALKLDITIPTSVERAMRRLREVVELAADRDALVLLYIEESHGVPDAILKFLKRIREALQDGWRERLPVVLVGQDDASASATGRSLSDTLRDPDNREVARRLTIIELRPLGNALPHYVRARVEAAEGKVERIFEDDWAAAVRRALKADHLVPQAVEHLLSRAMTLAHEMGDAKVGARHIDDAAQRGV